ncbi:MAG TPA: hypothetical protein DIT46_01090, partial [Gemmatimonadetes bacterium]|nr:hypothetical protein [Gemmatimonadota bacterium]
ITIADYTFIVNRTKTVAMAADTDAGRNPEAIFFVKQGDYGSSYTAEVTFGGTTYTTKVTTPNGGSASHRLDIATDVIVKAMVDGAAPGSGAGKDLTVTETNGGINGISGVTLSQSGSVLWVKSDD